MPPPTKPTTVALPPHPLVANKNGPLMSTAQLSLLLQKPPPPLRLEQDPITDDLDPAVSPSKRPMRRSQSENDAPIPSAASEWESRNLTASDRGTSKATAARGGGVGLAALVKKTDPRKKFQRSKTLGVDTGVGGNGAGAGVLSPPPVDGDVGPWSTDAFDLFDWRPPVKEAEEEGVVRDLV
ncbi:hypothetical protein EJ04DRAFT_514118 [Polyplosphaeria fusca]|uniref:Uncharacterized protein n=1 Tax=Polyplosphaeria fusca TaxID=682080 RepID=A0A9P4QWA3_9PLEO|nr:hypothetical protein EJ04DRAFT_514118 [Polyplosphaeria fusca]